MGQISIEHDLLLILVFIGCILSVDDHKSDSCDH